MGVADAFTAILDEIAAAKAAVPHPIRGTVTHADPLLVVLDDDPEGEPREVTDDAAGVWAVDDVVWLELRDTDLVITTTPTSMAKLREDADDLSDATAEAFDRLADLDNELDAAQTTATNAALAAADAQAVAEAASERSDQAEQQAAEALTASAEAVVSSIIEYALGASETVAPSTGWSTVSPTRTPGAYIWMRTKVTRGNGAVTYSSAALVTGNAGAPTYTWIKYADTPTTGMSDSPTGKTYIGIAVNKPSGVESTSYADYSWSLIKGDQGVAGPPGADGSPTYTWIKYADSAAGAGLSDSPTGKAYIGFAHNKSTATESTTPGDYLWSKILGDQGATGAQGVSVTSVTSYYRTVTAGSAAPAAPTTSTPPAPWSATEPAYAPGLDLYRVERVGYSTGTYSYTPVSKSSAYAAAVYVANLAEAATQGLVKVQADDPGHYVGRIWYQLHPTGHAQAGQLKALWRSDGTTWASYMLAANDILAPGTVKAGNLDFASMMGDVGYVTQLYTQGLVVSEGNLWPDPGFKTLIPTGWTKDGAGIVKTGTGTLTGGYVNLSEFPIAPGDTLAAQCVLEFTGTATGDFALYVQRRTKATGSWDNPVPLGNASASGVYSGAITTDVTAAGVYDAARIGFVVQANMPNTRSVRVSDVRIVRQNRAVHIANGAVGAAKINTVELASDATFTNTLAANTAFINSAVVRKLATNPAANRGVKIDDDAIRIYSNTSPYSLIGELNSTGQLYLNQIGFDGGHIKAFEDYGFKLETEVFEHDGLKLHGLISVIQGGLDLRATYGPGGGQSSSIEINGNVGVLIESSKYVGIDAPSTDIYGALNVYNSSVSVTSLNTTQPHYIASADGDYEPSFRLARNGNNFGRLYQTTAGGQKAIALEAGNRAAGTPGRFYLREDGGAMIVAPDGVWRYLPFAVYTGVESLSPAAVSTTYTKRVTFPLDRFTKTPVIALTPISTNPDQRSCTILNASAVGFDLQYRSTSASDFSCYVIAIQATV